MSETKQNEALRAAVERNDMGAARAALKGGANPNLRRYAQDYSALTVLHEASRKGWWRMVEVLLAAGADVEGCTDEGGNTPLMEAVLNNMPGTVARLMAAGADPHRENHDGQSATLMALRNQHPKVIAEMKIDPNSAVYVAEQARYQKLWDCVVQRFKDGRSYGTGSRGDSASVGLDNGVWTRTMHSGGYTGDSEGTSRRVLRGPTEAVETALWMRGMYYDESKVAALEAILREMGGLPDLESDDP